MPDPIHAVILPVELLVGRTCLRGNLRIVGPDRFDSYVLMSLLGGAIQLHPGVVTQAIESLLRTGGTVDLTIEETPFQLRPVT